MARPVPGALTVALIGVLLMTAVLVPGPVVAGPPRTTPSLGGGAPVAEENGTNVTDPMLEIGTLVEIHTNWGDMTLGMYEVGAPITTSNFLNLTRSGFFNGIKFHRIIDGFVIQTGDPNTKDNNLYNDGWGGSDETIPLEVSENLTHIDGAVGMARSSEPDSASSQFYVCDGPQHGLDGNYAVFAVVVEGMDTVHRISSAETYGNKRPLLKDHPVDDIIMYTVTVIHKDPEDEEEKPTGVFPMLKGVSVGVEGLFMVGIGLIVLVVVVFIVRKMARGRRLRFPREEVYEVELVEEFEEEGEGAYGQGWKGQRRTSKEWYED